jgi:LAGLIDADG endonuclease
MELPSYISGYVDGEGCFTITFSPRRGLRTGWEVRPSFSVSQNADRGEVILIIKEYFGCGSIRPDRSDKTIKYEVRRIDDLIEKVIPHFERYPLLSSKQKDFDRFARVCRLVQQGVHLTASGLREIVGLALEMNTSGKRKFVVGQIGQPWEPKGIVSATSNGGEPRSSDPHERHNDLGTVSTRASAKSQSP